MNTQRKFVSHAELSSFLSGCRSAQFANHFYEFYFNFALLLSVEYLRFIRAAQREPSFSSAPCPSFSPEVASASNRGLMSL